MSKKLQHNSPAQSAGQLVDQWKWLQFMHQVLNFDKWYFNKTEISCKFTGNAQDVYLLYEFENYYIRLQPYLPGDNE